MAHVVKILLLIVVVIGDDRVAAAQDKDELRPDLLTFANGVTVVSVEANEEGSTVPDERALAAIDGNPSKYLLTQKPGSANMSVAIVLELPSLTSFSDFAIPNVLETPSPSQTFFKEARILGSNETPDAGYVQLGEVVLEEHSSKGMVTRFESESQTRVRWVKIELSGGLDISSEKSFFDFSEILGYGEQDPVPMSQHFDGEWSGRGVRIGLNQAGSLVTGCYDKRGDLTGTVSGNVLRATGIGRDDRVQSLFILMIDEEGNLDGYRSTNGAPFRRYVGGPDDIDVSCRLPEEPVLSCGSIIHGITFDFDSAILKPDSYPVIDDLYRGLRENSSSEIIIEGHTSSEGSEDYNMELSQQRAQSVVDELVQRGIGLDRIAAIGLGESRPIADNGFESGRSLNRRVQVSCK